MKHKSISFLWKKQVVEITISLEGVTSLIGKCPFRTNIIHIGKQTSRHVQGSTRNQRGAKYETPKTSVKNAES